ncbi:PKD domain-containing protein, partial [bacterium]|nr:PKD domain-containing protein [bacterium]
KDRDGIFETNEQPLENVSVELRNSSDNSLAGSDNTNASGNYLFENVGPGSYYLTFTSPNLSHYTLSPQNQGSDETRDNDANPSTGRTVDVFLPSGVDTLDVDAGFYYVDTDGDSIPNVVEGPGDRDGDGHINLADYDPKGFIYDQVTGNLITGGTISVSGAGAGSVNIAEDGSTGLYQFFVNSPTPVNFMLSYTPPDGYMMSTTCDAQSTTLNPTPLPTPSVITLGSGRDGSTDMLVNWECSNNTYYWSFTLGQDDPFVINNNIPLQRSMPIAEFEADSTSGIDELCVQFNNLSRYADTYLWDFGDGETSTEENPLHCYNSSQKYYTVSLTATNVTGSDTETKTDYIVIVKQAVVNFTMMPLVGQPGTEVQFTNNSGGLISHWLWEFGDNEQLGLRHGTISSKKVHPAHIYEQSGEYTVSLKGWGHTGESTQIFEDMVCIDSTWAELELLGGSDVEDGFGWEKVLDNDLFSQKSYVAAQNDAAWAVFGFADTTMHLLDKVRLHANDAFGRIFRNNLAKDFELWVSVDNVSYEKCYSGTLSQKMAWETFVFEPVGAKYIKLVILSAVGESSPKVCLGEFQAFGIPVTEVSLSKNSQGLLSMVMGELVTDYALTQNYPNPFNPETTISFDVPEQAQVKLAVFNVTGQKVADLVNREVNAGRYKFNFDAHQLPSGVYFYRIEAGHFNATKRMLLIK